ncbi:THxN family PEP-CTERM protein [Marinobacter salinexigens]|uniref:THxN family PEP-CTERM protein n=1 Tax=Marinobacter salinexigens TaxID=2919747 RepID=UPI001FEC7D66|nr:THxN family PEP-CTERM protein [Marinobacter salinexigens]
MTILKSIVGGVALLTVSGVAAAFPVNLDSVSGQWVDAVGGQNVTGEGTNQIRWGGSYGNKSGYGFEANPLLPQTINDASPFVLGEFTHYNYEIPSDSAIDSVNLDVYASFSNGGGAVATGPFTFNFLHNETPNNAEVEHEVCGFLCQIFPWVGPHTEITEDGPVDDIVQILFDEAVLSSEFVLDGYVYSLSLLGFEGNATELYTEENGDTSVKLLASLNVSSVPEPGTIGLLGLGLLGLGVLSRKKAA